MSGFLKSALASVVMYFMLQSPGMAEQALSFDLSSIQGNGGGQALSYRYYLAEDLYLNGAYGREQVSYVSSGTSYPYSYSYWSGGFAWRFIEIDYKSQQNIQYDPGNPRVVVHHQFQINGVWETHANDVNYGVSVGLNTSTKLNVGIRIIVPFGKEKKTY